jgi:hypothetical protein
MECWKAKAFTTKRERSAVKAHEGKQKWEHIKKIIPFGSIASRRELFVLFVFFVVKRILNVSDKSGPIEKRPPAASGHCPGERGGAARLGRVGRE